MKILLINPPIREWSQPNMFPQGLGYIAAALRNAGHEVEVHDINAHRWRQAQVEDKIKEADFDVVGTGSLITTYKYLKWLMIKRVIQKLASDVCNILAIALFI